MAKLTPKQARFVQEYLIDLNATSAARRAKYSEKTACEQAARLLANVKVQAAIQEAMRRRERRTEVTQDYVIGRLREIADKDASDTQDSELKYANKIRALELLGKHLGLFDKRGGGAGMDGEGEDDLSRSLRELGEELDNRDKR